MANNYLPRTDTGKMQWLNNFAAKLPNYREALELTAATVKECQQDAENFAYIISGIDGFRQYTQQATAYKNLLRDGNESNKALLDTPPPPPAAPVLPHPPVPDIFGRIGKLVQVIKNSKGYNEAIGKDLGTFGEAYEKDMVNAKPILVYELLASRPNIKWKKNGMQGIHLYADRNDGKGYQFLATDTQPDYLDTYPLPAAGQAALWKYKAIYIDHDEETGQMSDELTVSVSGNL